MTICLKVKIRGRILSALPFTNLQIFHTKLVIIKLVIEMPVVYIDVLFLINFIIDTSLLITSATFCGQPLKILRTVAGGFFGGVYACLTVVFPILSYLKFPVSLIILTITFAPKPKKQFLKLLSAFYLQTFLLSGSITTTLYYPLTTPKLLITALPLLAVITYFYKKQKNRLLTYGKNCTVNLTACGKTLQIKGIIDSGNSLTDPLSGLPVIVTSAENFARGEILGKIKNKDFAELMLTGKFYIIPCKTLSGENILLGTKPEKCEIVTTSGEKKELHCTLALAPDYEKEEIIINPLAIT